MIVSCPNCETRFNLDPSAFKNGRRRVRCGRCGHKWTATDPRGADPIYDEPDPFAQMDDAPELDMEAVAARRARAALSGRPEPDDHDELEDGERRGGRLALWIGLGLVGALAIAGGGYYAMQQGLLDDLTLTAPSAEAPAQPEPPVASSDGGLPIIDESATRVRLIEQEREGRTIRVFEVTGVIRNESGAPIRVPPMVGRFQDAEGTALFYNDDPDRPAVWTFDAPTPALQPNETARFRTIVDIAAAPARAENIEITFGR